MLPRILERALRECYHQDSLDFLSLPAEVPTLRTRHLAFDTRHSPNPPVRQRETEASPLTVAQAKAHGVGRDHHSRLPDSGCFEIRA
jgi:hypothetical protein